MNNEILLIADDLGCAYVWRDGCLQSALLMKDGTLDMDDFGAVEPDMVGEEMVTFEGNDTNLYGVYATVKQRLHKRTFDKLMAEYDRFLEQEDLPELSADELIVQTNDDDIELVTDAQRAWLADFIERWELMEEIR